MLEHLKETYRYRALLWSMIQRDLSSRYRGSAFGFLWTFLNPLLLMSIYSLVFMFFMRTTVPHYTYFLMCGLLPWLWFSTSLLTGTSSIVDRRDMINKVRVAPQVLPLTVVCSAFVNYLMTLPLILALALIEHVDLGWPLLAWPLIAFLQFVFTVGLVYVTASVNVVFRDLQHLLANFITFWFYLTPVLYPLTQIPEKYRRLMKIGNPMIVVMGAYQDIFVNHQWPEWAALAKFAVVALAMFYFGLRFLNARREGFAEAT